MKSVLINGVNTHCVDSFSDLVSYVNDNPCILVAVNAEKIYHATEETRRIINTNFGYPDGIGAVMALRKKGLKQQKRIPGCELWLEIIKEYYKTKKFYFVGSKPEIIDATVKKIKSVFTGIEIAGYRNGYFKSDREQNELIDDIASKKPDIIFVAMGSPKQELLMMEMQKRHQAVYQGLGGSFDVYTEHVKRAPLLFRKLGLEWFARFLREPTRFKRHKALLQFFFNLYFTNKY